MLFDHKNSVESPFNFGLFVKGGMPIEVEKYLQNCISSLSQDIDIPVYHLQQLPFDYIFTDIEFNKQIPDENEESFINRHFYTKLFKELKKKKVVDETKNKSFLTWEYRCKYCFTFDRTLAPSISSSGIHYGTMNLGSKPVLYYIWVDTQAIINLIKTGQV